MTQELEQRLREADRYMTVYAPKYATDDGPIRDLFSRRREHAKAYRDDLRKLGFTPQFQVNIFRKKHAALAQPEDKGNG